MSYTSTLKDWVVAPLRGAHSFGMPSPRVFYERECAIACPDEFQMLLGLTPFGGVISGPF